MSGATNKSKAKAKSHDVSKPKPKQKVLTQLHFSVDTTILRTCPLCDLSYTKGAPDDEALHKAHCARVLKGMEWGREEEREQVKVGVEEVAVGVKLKNGKKGRIICFKADAGGKIGQKVLVLIIPRMWCTHVLRRCALAHCSARNHQSCALLATTHTGSPAGV